MLATQKFKDKRHDTRRNRSKCNRRKDYCGKQIYRDVKIHPFNNVILPEKFICPIVKKKLYPNDRSSIMY